MDDSDSVPITVVETTGYEVQYAKCKCGYAEKTGVGRKRIERGWASSDLFAAIGRNLDSSPRGIVRTVNTIEEIYELDKPPFRPDAYILFDHPAYKCLCTSTILPINDYIRALFDCNRKDILPADIIAKQSSFVEEGQRCGRKWPALDIDLKSLFERVNKKVIGEMEQRNLFVDRTIVVEVMPDPAPFCHFCAQCKSLLPISSVTHHLSPFHVFKPQSWPRESVGVLEFRSAPYALPKPKLRFI